jgi:hypothetical protein
MMFRVFASNGAGGLSIVLDKAKAALQKLNEFRDEGFRIVSVLDLAGAPIEEAALMAIAEAEENNASS